jgi:hypothetical protein
MQKTRTKKPIHTRGAHHDVKPTQPAPRPTERALQPTTPTSIKLSRAIDQELEWYFSYAESALHRERVGMLPSHAAAQVKEPTDAAIQSRAHEIACIVRGCLLAMQPAHAEVLRAVYTPRTWPKNVFAEFECVSPIVVRLAFAGDPWPVRSARAGLEHAAAVQLSAALTSASVSVPKLRRKADALLRRAVVAYSRMRSLARVRGSGACVIPSGRPR